MRVRCHSCLLIFCHALPLLSWHEKLVPQITYNSILSTSHTDSYSVYIQLRANETFSHLVKFRELNQILAQDFSSSSSYNESHVLLHCILGSPLPSSGVMPRPVSFEKLCNVWHQGIIGIGIRQEGADREQDLANRQSRTPLILEDIKADSSVGVDVAVVDPSGKVDLGRFEWVIRREVNIEKKDSACIGRIVRSHDCGLPVEHVITNGSCRAVRWRILAQVHQF